MQKLKTNNPRVVKKYIEKLHDNLEKDKVFQQTHNSYMLIGENRLNSAQVAELEELDKLCTNAMQVAKGQCRKLKIGATQWSPEPQVIQDKKRYYSLSQRKTWKECQVKKFIETVKDNKMLCCR